MAIYQKPPKIIFRVASPEILAKNIYCLLKKTNLEEYNYKMLVDKISFSLVKKIKKSKSFNYVEKELIYFIKVNTDKNIKEKTKKLEKIWEKIYSKKFFFLLSRYFNEFYYKKFYCYTNNLVISNKSNKNYFFIKIRPKIKDSVYSICEETLHLIYQRLLKEISKRHLKMKNKEFKIEDNEIAWRISETIPEFIFNFKILYGKTAETLKIF